MKTKLMVFTGILTILLTISLIGTKSFFNQREINAAKAGCEQTGGQPVLEEGFLTLNYYFQCE
ncbi:hypothetical protein D4T97_011555 [Siminovitchia acidinfaciens]|uniref:Uncharacterized protein n=1 Tax=Siminovitchia acidinfaciens TaxID=2321395 RepID=A0A429XZT9_9BACI|nr:hypothetical protein [Siminovitchia acidinfaciens]RST74300.1 hypothetical protein D4T97_011555 [Siminovitchia acidinfaciens]